jgi:UDP-N-acetyl-D-glucosamine dehydrogenase
MTLAPLLSAIETRAARIGVVGLGYVGLPLILRLAEAGLDVTFADNLTDRSLTDMIAAEH